MNTLKLAAASLTALLTVSATPAGAAVELGLLECNVEGGAGFIFGSSKNLTCEFIPANDALPSEIYTGVINKYGIDIGVTGETVIAWIVFAPTADIEFQPGSLAGTYVGASAEASAAIGGGANILVGGSNDTFSLQPVSVQAQEGVNVAVGIAELKLNFGG